MKLKRREAFAQPSRGRSRSIVDRTNTVFVALSVFFLIFTFGVALFVLKPFSIVTPANKSDEQVQTTGVSETEYISAVQKIMKTYRVAAVKIEIPTDSASSVSAEQYKTIAQAADEATNKLVALTVPTAYKKVHLELVLAYAQIKKSAANIEHLITLAEPNAASFTAEAAPDSQAITDSQEKIARLAETYPWLNSTP